MITEVELKYEVTTFESIKERLLEVGGKLIHTEEREQNIVFDFSDSTLQKENKLLRLREYGKKVYLTVKEPVVSKKMKIRDEHESLLSIAFDEAKQMIKALNFIEVFSYEKFREIWQVDKSINICLDRLFYGNFVEIEGNSIEEVERVSSILGFDSNSGIKASYRSLQIKAKKRNFVKS